MSESAPVPEELLAHASFLRNLARSLLADANDADDVVQETWSALLRRPPAHRQNLAGWLAHTTRNFARRHRRSASRRTEHEGHAARAAAISTHESLVARDELFQSVVAAIQSLDEPYRAVLYARYYEDLPPREIARRFGVPVETIRTRLKRALEQLRARLQGAEEDWRSGLAVLAGIPTGESRGLRARALAKRATPAPATALLVLLGVVFWTTRPERPPVFVEADQVKPSGVDVTSIPALLPHSRREPAMTLDHESVLLALSVVWSLLLPQGDSGVTRLVSVGFDSSGNAVVGNGHSRRCSVSANGRYVAFSSEATNLVPQSQDTNGCKDVFVRDLLTEETYLISRGVSTEADGASDNPVLTPDGAYVVFDSAATNLVASDGNGVIDIFRVAIGSLPAVGPMELVSLDHLDQPSTGNSYAPTVSDDGSVIAFSSAASNLTPNAPNGPGLDIYVRDLAAGTTVLVSADSNGVPANRNQNEDQAISGDGRFITYWSNATNLDPADNNDAYDVFVFDRTDRSTRLVSINLNGNTGGPNGVQSSAPSISGDGHYISFVSAASDLVLDDLNGMVDVFVRDTWALETTLASPVSGQPTSGYGVVSNGTMTHDGRFLTFYGGANVGFDTNGFWDVYRIDRDRDGNGAFDSPPRIERASVGPVGQEGDDQSVVSTFQGSITEDGSRIVFTSLASSFAAPLADSSGLTATYDVFVRDMRHARRR